MVPGSESDATNQRAGVQRMSVGHDLMRPAAAATALLHRFIARTGRGVASADSRHTAEPSHAWPGALDRSSSRP
jgi:hypothetical protein